LAECEERIYSKENGIQSEKMGLFMIRGDNLAMMGKKDLLKKFIKYLKIGEVDEDIEMNLDMNAIKAEQLKPFIN